jgi:hypothetical protein
MFTLRGLPIASLVNSGQEAGTVDRAQCPVDGTDLAAYVESLSPAAKTRPTLECVVGFLRAGVAKPAAFGFRLAGIGAELAPEMVVSVDSEAIEGDSAELAMKDQVSMRKMEGHHPRGEIEGAAKAVLGALQGFPLRSFASLRLSPPRIRCGEFGRRKYILGGS